MNHNRVRRLMREAGLQGLYRRRHRSGGSRPATEDDLVNRRFTVDGPDRLWLTDIVRHEALSIRVGVRDPSPPGRRSGLVVAGGSLIRETSGRVGSSPDDDETGQHCQMVRARQA